MNCDAASSAIVDREIAGRDMGLEIGGEAVDGLLQHACHNSGGRHPASVRQSPSRCGSPSRRRAGTATGYRPGRIPAAWSSTSRAGSKLKATWPCSSASSSTMASNSAVLVGEIDVERALGDAGGAGDLAHAGAVKAEIHEHLAGAIENLAALRAVLVADEMKRVRGGCNHWFSFSGKISTPGIRIGRGFRSMVVSREYNLTEPFGQ